tara:strand:+ start:9225 stop:11135 length:1911 start_codon:yes stop_codon:yes gene_type:complete
MPRKPKSITLQPFSAKILKGLKTVGKKHKIAQIHHDILQDINATHKQIRKQTMLVKKTPDDLQKKDYLAYLKSQKQSKERQIQAWIKAKKPTTMEKFEKFISEGCSMDEARLPNNIGDISFKNCILKNMRFIPSKLEVKKIRESIPNLTNDDYRIIILNGHGAIEGGIVIQGDIRNKPTIRQAKNAPVVLPKLPNGMWYFAQGYPGTSTMMCKRVDTAQFQNLNSLSKRNNFVRRLFSDGTFQTFLEGKSYDESDTAMVGIPTMPFYNKAWDFGQWSEHRTIMGIYDVTDPNYSVNIDATRQDDPDGTFVYPVYPTLSEDKSPSDVLRSHTYFKGTIAKSSNNEPNTNQFHHKRLEKIRDLLRKFKTKNNRIPTKEELAIITKDITFSFTAYGKTDDYPLKLTAANNKFQRVYRNLLFASDWAPLRDSSNGVFDPIAKGSDGVSIRQRMIDTMNSKRDITMDDLLKWFNPNAPNAVDKRKVIFIDWSCQPISVRVQYDGRIRGVDFDTAPDPTQPYPPEKIPSLLGFQATRLAFEKMARNLNLTFNRVQSLFNEKNGEEELGASPFIAKIEADKVGEGDYLLNRSARDALSPVPMDVDAISKSPTQGGRRKNKTRRKSRKKKKSRRKRRRRKTRRK